MKDEPLWHACRKPLISAAMIVKNEAKNLKSCLRSIASVVDEVVLLDTGSTDETMDIGRALGAQVYEEPWQQNFSLHRNHAIDRCRGEWILVIDGDELLEPAGDLRDVIQTRAGLEEADSVMVRIDAIRESGIAEQYFAIRAFLKARGRYEYPVHNQLRGVTRPVGSTAVIQASYRGTMMEKAERSIPILERLVKESPEDPHGPFFLCKTYRSLGDGKNTLKWGKRCMELVPENPGFSVCWVWLFHAAFAEEGPEAAEEILRLAGEKYLGLADLRHCRMMMEAYRWQEAAKKPGSYACSPQASIQYVSNFPEASCLLGLPFQFQQHEQKSGLDTVVH